MIETGKELAVAVKKIATSYKTLYVMGWALRLRLRSTERNAKHRRFRRK